MSIRINSSDVVAEYRGQAVGPSYIRSCTQFGYGQRCALELAHARDLSIPLTHTEMLCYPCDSDACARVKKNWKTGEDIMTPVCICDYNKNMGGVDNIDSRIYIIYIIF